MLFPYFIAFLFGCEVQQVLNFLIMYVPEKLKLNKFKQVNIPSPAEYFRRFGYMGVPDIAYSDDPNVFLGNESKIDTIARMSEVDTYQAYAEQMAAQQSSE